MYTRLRQEADKCQFTDVDRELLTQIMTGCRSSNIRRRALERQLKLSELIELARSMEKSEERAGEQEDSTAAVRPVSSHVPQTKHKTQCRHYGYSYPHKGECPAKGKTYSKCHKVNHFAAVSRSSFKPRQSVKAVNVDNQNHSESDDDEVPCHLADEYMFALKSGALRKSP